jgi:uncharacterized protein (TIGR00730 family)
LKKVTIFCASSSKVADIFFREARIVAEELAERNIEILFGGGDAGLMGAIASVYLEKGKQITGIIPEFMIDNGWAHPTLKHLVRVRDMSERKNKLIYETDAILALPGGPGTLEELSQAITMKQLGQITIPIVLLNTEGYFNTLLTFLDQMIRMKFMRIEHAKMWSVIDDPRKVIHAIEHAPKWDVSSIGLAKI